jgi:uncharacterized membrane protein YsdA (DUF1294 family)
MQNYLIYYILMINCIGLWSMWEDKRRAVKRKYRLSEKTLFIIAIIGGSIGSIIGMYTFRHKTKHWYFKVGLPTILLFQLLAWAFDLGTVL